MMMSLTVKKNVLGASHQRTQRAPSHVVRPTRAARPIAVAGLKEGGDWLASGFLKIFTPPNDSGVNWTGTSSGYSVAPRKGRGRNPAPVSKQKRASDTGEMYASRAEQQEEAVKGSLAVAADYMAGALQRVMGHNFKGDESEPNWKATGQRGWSGDIRKRDKDGFHSRKL